MGQKLSSKLFFIYSPNNDGFYIVYIPQGSVATQFRCGGMFSHHFTTNLSQNSAVKKIENRSIIGKDMDKTLWLTFLGHPVDYVDIYGRSSAWVRGSTIETQWAK